MKQLKYIFDVDPNDNKRILWGFYVYDFIYDTQFFTYTASAYRTNSEFTALLKRYDMFGKLWNLIKTNLDTLSSPVYLSIPNTMYMEMRLTYDLDYRPE